MADLAAVNLTVLSDEDCVRLVDGIEGVSRRLQAAGLPVLREVTVRRAFSKAGFGSPVAMLKNLLRLRPGVARKRLEAMDALTSSMTPSGEVIEPRFPETAAALRDGVIDLDHAAIVMDVMAKIPSKVDAEQRENAEAALAQLCQRYTPPEVERIGDRIVEYLDPDGTLTDDSDRARHRGLSLGKQSTNLMSKITGHLDPVTRALLDVMLSVWAAKGMNNPGDPLSPSGAIDDPALDKDILQAAADNDIRSQAQRNHDALKAALLYLIESGQMGKSHRGLPVQVIISMTKDQLDDAVQSSPAGGDVVADNVDHNDAEAEAPVDAEPEVTPKSEPRPYGSGVAYTATGTILPIGDAVKLAVRSDKSLAIFENHSNEVLYFGRARRLASESQRLAMFAAHRGCSTPGCSNPAMWAEAHHVLAWLLGGFTDIVNEAPACPQHHKLIGPGVNQWQTVMLTEGPDAGRCAWIPPVFIDPERKPMVNRAHHPDEALAEARELMRSRRLEQLEQRKREFGVSPSDLPKEPPPKDSGRDPEPGRPE
ncbi:HNH endonuclease signature motif containing protein [Nocardia sp. 348MFTsu5.1]|uniref:HNH endonuclease signature motif containing protein n=1 Tax=Nocardia sp. 348MFTsu5.1 TaxID=1172185 RepID=UPI0003A57D98|nr:HNH endonuclease signature motif containing protein [Nocardia sp. 348MFTsu5.1]